MSKQYVWYIVQQYGWDDESRKNQHLMKFMVSNEPICNFVLLNSDADEYINLTRNEWSYVAGANNSFETKYDPNVVVKELYARGKELAPFFQHETIPNHEEWLVGTRKIKHAIDKIWVKIKNEYATEESKKNTTFYAYG